MSHFLRAGFAAFLLVWIVVLVKTSIIAFDADDHQWAQCGSAVNATCTDTDPCDADATSTTVWLGGATAITSVVVFVTVVALIFTVRQRWDRWLRASNYIFIIAAFAMAVLAVLTAIYAHHDLRPWARPPYDASLKQCSRRDAEKHRSDSIWAAVFAGLFFFLGFFLKQYIIYWQKEGITTMTTKNGDTYAKISGGGPHDSAALNMVSHNGHTHLTAATRRANPTGVAQSSFSGVLAPNGTAYGSPYNPEGQVSSMDWAFRPQPATMLDPETNTVVPSLMVQLGSQPQAPETTAPQASFM